MTKNEMFQGIQPTNPSCWLLPINLYLMKKILKEATKESVMLKLN